MPDIDGSEEAMFDTEKLTPLENKLAQVRKSLLEDLPIEELSRLQVHAEALENALMAGNNYHHHDTNEHHDHQTIALSPGLEPRVIRRRT